MVRNVQDILNTPLDEMKPIEYWLLFQETANSEPVLAVAKTPSELPGALEKILGRKLPEKYMYARGYFSELNDGTKLIIVNSKAQGMNVSQYKEKLGRFFYENPNVSDDIMGGSLLEIYVVTEAEPGLETTKKTKKEAKLVRRYNKNRGRTEWALVSRSDPKKVLRWFGPRKPSREQVLSEERRVQWFKHKGSIKNSWLVEEVPIVERKDEHPSTKDDVELKRRWLSGPRDHLDRNDVFGPHTDTEFGSGLLKKDKELYPRWEFTETPQFRQNAQEKPLELPQKYGPYNPLLIAGQLGQLKSVIQAHDKFVNWINQIVGKFDKIARGILTIDSLAPLVKGSGATDVKSYIEKEVSNYLEELTSPSTILRLTMIREGIPDVLSTIAEMRENINNEMRKIREILSEQLPAHDMPQIRSVTPDVLTELPISPESFSFKDWEKIQKSKPGYQAFEERLVQLTNVRNQFDEIARQIEKAIEQVHDYVDRLLAWQDPEVQNLSELLNKLYDASVEGLTKPKSMVNFEGAVQEIENILSRKIKKISFEEATKVIGVLLDGIKVLENLYRTAVSKLSPGGESL
jgi:hypothetical protein